MKYIVTEIQMFDSGAITTPSYAYDDRNAAESKYHAILSAAAPSSLPVHSAIMFTQDGEPLAHKAYKHMVTPAEEELPEEPVDDTPIDE